MCADAVPSYGAKQKEEIFRWDLTEHMCLLRGHSMIQLKHDILSLATDLMG